MRKQTASINDLILFSVFNIENREKECGFESLVKECFSQFPKRFCFFQYSKWPDSRKLDSALRKLRQKKLLVGNPKTFFALTSQGKKEAQVIAKILRQKKLL